jgi:hypothetical protein
MAEKCVKKCPTSLAISARQIKILLRLYLIPVRMAIKKTNNNKCWQECVKKGPEYTVGGTVNQCSHYGNQ